MISFTMPVRMGPGSGKVTIARPLAPVEQAVRSAWVQQCGIHRAPDGPLVLDILERHERPDSHTRSGGRISAEGKRHMEPAGLARPTATSWLVQSALTGFALAPGQVVELRARSLWDTSSGLDVNIRSAGASASVARWGPEAPGTGGNIRT